MPTSSTPRDIVGLTLKQAAGLTALGLAIGLALAAVLGRLMSAAVFGLISLEPATFGAVGAWLVVVSFGAAYVPARRAIRVDPVAILRTQ